jgi:hypothetical protein
MFGNEEHSPPLLPIIETDQTPAPIRTERIGAHLRLPSAVTRDEADRLAWCEVQLQWLSVKKNSDNGGAIMVILLVGRRI